MIAKRVLTPKGGSGYQRLSGYVLNVRQEHREATDPASWTHLGAYILDTPHEGEKVAWARATNCDHDDPGWAVKHILSVQERNTRSKSDKSYHLVVSFPEGERPTRAQMGDIEDRLCHALGFGEHQRVSAVHQNTDNWHLHVAVNKVHPVTLRNITPIRDHFRLQAACVELEREKSVRARDAAIADLAERHRAYGHELTAWYRQRLRQERTQGLKGALRRESFQHIAAEREKDRKARVQREREERRQTRAAHSIPNWQGYLEAEAAKGHEQALAILRSRQRRIRRLETEVLTAENADRARHVVHGHMKPAVRRDGRVIYRVTDGGIVSDEAAHVRVPQPTTAAAFLALSLAANRFGDRPLIVRGTDAFRLQLAAVAAIEGMSVRFADPALERERVGKAHELRVYRQGRTHQHDTGRGR